MSFLFNAHPDSRNTKAIDGLSPSVSAAAYPGFRLIHVLSLLLISIQYQESQ